MYPGEQMVEIKCNECRGLGCVLTWETRERGEVWAKCSWCSGKGRIWVKPQAWARAWAILEHG